MTGTGSERELIGEAVGPAPSSGQGGSGAALGAWRLARRSLRWAGNAAAAVLVIGSLGACCGAIPLATILAGAGVAGLVGGVAALAASIGAAALVALVASLRGRGSGAGCCSPVGQEDRP